MAFITNMESAFLTELNTQLTIPVILDYQSGPEPSGDYGVFGITTLNKLNRDTRTSYPITGGGFEERLKQDYEILVTMSFYGNTCYDNAFEAQSLFSSQDTLDRFLTNECISIIDVTSVRRIPELRDTGYVQRATFDLNFLIGFELIKNIDWFDTVDYTGEVQDPGGNVVTTVSDTVTF